MKNICGIFIWSILHLTQIFSQQKVYISQIDIQGLKHTKLIVIYRELDIAVGDSIKMDQLANKLEINEQRLLSTGLFNIADFNITKWDEQNNAVNLTLTLSESWYIYPSIIFELADRNFNVWWKEMNRDFSRVNYGVRLDHLNFTGRKDKLKLKYQLGYTKKYELDYRLPYIRKDFGFGYNILFSENKEIGYKTEGNKVLFKKYPEENILLKRFRTSLLFTQRINGLANHYFKTEYNYNSVDDKVIGELNPSYFPDGARYLQYLRLEYGYEFNKTIYPLYPEGGYSFKFLAIKDGIGFGNYSNTLASFEIAKHFSLSNKIFLSLSAKGKTNLTNNIIPYFNNNAIGYGEDDIRGYELYVIDGTRYTWIKSALKFKMLDKIFHLGKYMPLSAMKNFPLRCYIRFSYENGYSYEPTYLATNSFNNRWLHGFGPSLDIILYNIYSLSMEYNTNHLGERGLYFKSSFSL
jgi:outer membrane protein assembly factor BamA